jgi:hypothetical protein
MKTAMKVPGALQLTARKTLILFVVGNFLEQETQAEITSVKTLKARERKICSRNKAYCQEKYLRGWGGWRPGRELRAL